MPYTLRDMLPTDADALQRLMETDPPKEGMTSTTLFRVDPYTAWKTLKPNMVGVVAEMPGSSEIAGSATIAFEEVQLNGQVRMAGNLENLKVHHEHRGKGLGTQLAQWRIEKARELYGAECLILTGTSSDNTASQATMKKWCKQFFRPMLLSARPAYHSVPKPPRGLTVRPATPADYAEIAAQSNTFYQAYNLYPPLSSEKLTQRVDNKIFHYRVVMDNSGHLLAGAMCINRAALMVDEFKNVPPPLRLMNTFMNMLPEDNLLLLMEVDSLWFTDLLAAQHLWRHLRYEFRTQASSFSAVFDPRSPLKDVFQIKAWHMPKIEIVLALSETMDTQRFTSGMLRG